jgi:hypothetical protein
VYLVHKRPIVYQACGSVIVTAPTVSEPNVYNSPPSPLIVTASLVAQQLMSDAVRHDLQAQGLTAAYQAELFNNGTPEAPQYSEPLTNVCASSYDPELSLRTAHGVIQEFGTILRARQQANAAPQTFMNDAVVVAPVSLPVLGRPSQAYLGVAAIGVILTVTCVVWADPFFRLWSQWRGRSGAAGNGRGPRKRVFGTLRPWRAIAADRSGGD